MANIVLRSGFDLLKGAKSDVFDLPAFNISAVTITADGDVAKALKDDSVLHQQMVDAVNEQIDSAKAKVDRVLAVQTSDFDKRMNEPADGDLVKKTKALEAIQDECVAELEEIAKALPAELSKALQKAFDTHNARAKLGLKYKVTVVVKATLGVLAIAGGLMRLVATMGADFTAYLVIIRQQLALVEMIRNNLKTAEQAEKELAEMMGKLSHIINEEHNRLLKSAARSAAVFVLPCLESNVPQIKTAITKAEMINTKLVAIDDSCKTMLKEVEKDMKELDKQSKGGDAEKIKTLKKNATSKLDQIGEIQEGLKTKWEHLEEATATLDEWKNKRFKAMKVTGPASTLGGAASKLYGFISEAVSMAG
jgi:DNA repair exonuclease SbcCD ATPase subunit